MADYNIINTYAEKNTNKSRGGMTKIRVSVRLVIEAHLRKNKIAWPRLAEGDLVTCQTHTSQINPKRNEQHHFKW